MAIKVQVKETGTSKVQPNLFTNGATMGMGAYDFIGVQPTAGGAFGAWNTPVYNAWNMPFNGFNAMNDVSNLYTNFNTGTPSFAASNLPYARQNAFIGQLPGLWQRESMTSPFAATSAYAAPAMGLSPWAFGLNGQFAGMTSPVLGTTQAHSVSPMINAAYGLNGLNGMGINGMGINTLGLTNAALSQQAAITGQPVVAHLPIDILDDGTQYLLVADLPGVKIDDLELTVENGVLVIKAVAQSTTFIPGIDVTAPVATIAREKAPVKIYQRAFVIGRDITVEDITASISNGVLTISLPKVNVITGTNSRIRNTVAACA